MPPNGPACLYCLCSAAPFAPPAGGQMHFRPGAHGKKTEKSPCFLPLAFFQKRCYIENRKLDILQRERVMQTRCPLGAVFCVLFFILSPKNSGRRALCTMSSSLAVAWWVRPRRISWQNTGCARWCWRHRTTWPTAPPKRTAPLSMRGTTPSPAPKWPG